VLENVIRCNETWIFQYNLEAKRWPVCWKASFHQEWKNKKLHIKLKAMAIVLFDIRGVIMVERVLDRQTINQKY
jgi:hypothetical protein